MAQQRLYQLVRQRGLIADRTFEIVFEAPGVEAYVFTSASARRLVAGQGSIRRAWD